MREIKLKDIADELGVSVVSVSNALSGKKGVSDALREKIIQTAERLGYDIKKYEKREMSTVKIGVIVSEKYLEIGSSFYWALYQQLVYVASKKNGITLLEIVDESTLQKEKISLLSEGNIDGLIILGALETDFIEKIVKTSVIPVVLLDFYIQGLECDAVVSSNYIGMYKATKYLLERGHREIAFMGSIYANDNIMDRYFGYRKAMLEQGIPIRSDWILKDRDILHNEMQLEIPKNMPTAFVCNCDLTASLLKQELERQGYCIPDDISIVGYDNYLYGDAFAEELTTYNVDMDKMAKKTLSLLWKRIKGMSSPFVIRYIDSNMIERKSVKSLL